VIFLGLMAITVCVAPHCHAEPISVFVTILPQRNFVEQVGGNRVAIEVMIPPGAGHETYEPKPRQMAALSAARLYFAIGAPFEKKWLSKTTSTAKKLKVISTAAGIEKIPLEMHGHGDSEADHDDHHPEGELDPHIWLSPPLVKIQARHIMEALSAADPPGTTFYRENYSRFAEQLDALNAQIQNLLVGLKNRHFMVFHPAWGYFAQAYGLTQVPIELRGQEPDPATLSKQIALGKKLEIRVIFIQPQFSRKGAQVISKAIGARIVEADPLDPDWTGGLIQIAQNLKAAAE
jgi:zinc transport system substrate-binding protein